MADDAALPPLPYDLDEWERRCRILFTTCHSTAGTLALIAHVRALREALEIIAGERQCIDNLMSHGDVARAALAASRKENRNAD